MCMAWSLLLCATTVWAQGSGDAPGYKRTTGVERLMKRQQMANHSLMKRLRLHDRQPGIHVSAPANLAERQRLATPGMAVTPRMASGSNAPEILGFIDYANSWVETGNQYGLYRLTPGSNSYEMVLPTVGIDINGGAAIYDGLFHGISYYVDWTTFEFIGTYYEYDLATGKPTPNSGRNAPDMSTWAYCTAYDPTDGTVYGCTQDETYEYDAVLSKIDYNTLTSQPIRGLDASFASMAIDGNGQLWAISYDGMLMKVDKATGATTNVGTTGITPSQYFMSAAFDHTTGTLYWAATDEMEDSYLFEVDTVTGKATPVSVYSDNENVTFLYVEASPADGAPMAATDLRAQFDGGSLTGKITFTMPTATYDGSTLEGTVSYTVTDNGAAAATGTAAPGSTVTADVTVAAAGQHKFAVTLANDAGESKQAVISLWVGADESASASDVTLTISDGKATLTWTAPERGVNGGYIDPATLSYDITRYPGGEVVATGHTATTFEDALPEVEYTAWYYTVTTRANGGTSAAVASNPVCHGNPITPPFTADFTDPQEANLFLVVDNNHDNISWVLDDGYMAYYSSDADLEADDWVILPPVYLSNDRQYTFSFEATCYSESDREYLAVAMGGDELEDVSQYTLLAERIEIHSVVPVPVTHTVTVEQSGAYCFAIKALDWTGLAVYVDNVSVQPGSMTAAPAAADNLTVKPAPDGSLQADIVFTAPSKAIDGSALSGDLTIKLYRGNEPEPVRTVEGVQPGAETTLTDTPLTGGTTYYAVVASNSYGNGLKASASAYVGKDTPLPPTDIVLADNLDGTATLTWTAPADKGVNGGYVDTGNLLYNVYSVNEGTPSLLAKDINGNRYDITGVPETGDQHVLYYAMKSVTGDLQSDYATSTMLLTGAPYNLPFRETFANGSSSHYWATNSLRGEGYFGFTTEMSSDADGGAAFFYAHEAGDEAVLSSGKISLAGAAQPYLYFDYYLFPGADIVLKAVVKPNGGQGEEVAVLDFKTLDGQAGWRRAILPLGEFASAKYLTVDFDAAVTDYDLPVVVDNIIVKDVYDYDLEVSLSAPDRVTAGTEATFTATVANGGLNNVAAYTVDLYVDGKQADTRQGSDLQPGQEQAVAFTYKMPIGRGETARVYAVVSTAIDMDEANNTTAEAIVETPQPTYPTVDDLAASLEDGNVKLTWTPMPADAQNVVTDGFEEYEAFTIGDAGEWKLVDADEAYTYEPSTAPYPHAGEAMAYIVFNPPMLGESNAGIMPHGGDQYMASMAAIASMTPDGHNDDWLISPELSGRAQTVSFFVKSLQASYGLEQYEVWYSTTDADVQSFTRLLESEAPADAWTEVKADLPEGSRYFAIRCVSPEAFMFMVDDVTYEAKPLEVTGYHVYRDGEQIAATAEAGYTDSGVSGDHTYNVTVVYSVGESAFSNSVSIQASGVDGIAAGAVVVTGGQGCVSVYNAAGRHVGIFTPSGVAVHAGQGSDRLVIDLLPGAYIVKVDGAVFKVWVE